MSSPEIEKYITEARAKGMSNDAIRQELLRGGWNANEVDASFSPQTIPLPEKKTSRILIAGLALFGVIVLLGIIGSLTGNRSLKIQTYAGKVQITEVTGFPSYLDGRNVVTNNNGTWYVWGAGKSWDDSYFEIKDAIATPIKFDWKTKRSSFGFGERFSSHPDSPAAYSTRLRTLGTPSFVNDSLNNWYLVLTQNDPSTSYVLRIANGTARPVFDAPNVDLDFKGDGSGNFYAFIAFITQANTAETAVFRINGETMTEIQGLRNGFDHSFVLNGPNSNYVVLTDGKGTDYDHPHRFAGSHVYQIVSDNSVKITQLEGYNRGISLSVVNGDVYARAQSNTKGFASPECPQCNLKPDVTDYYKIEGAVAKKIDKLPEPKPQKNYGGETHGGGTATFEDEIGNKYEMVTKVGEPFWKCELFKVEDDQRYSVIDGLNDVGCADVYTDKKGEWIVVEKGDIYGGSKTKVYKLQGKNAFYIKDFEGMRWLTLSHDDIGNFWYGTTQSDKGIPAERHVYKISFE